MWRRASLGLLAVLCGCAARTPDSGRSVQGITGGVADSEHTAVFLVAEETDQGLNAFCSSTLIAPNLILTAHHCVVGDLPSGGVQCGVTQFGPAVPASELFAANDQVVDGNTAFYPAQ
ncbi:MAG TPA: trypsin-like serine protease, partial [Polyangiaceae bacterium]